MEMSEEDCGLQWMIVKDDFGDLHVIPLNDTKPHSIARDCLCCPEEDGDEIVHNSYDGREAFEEGLRKLS